MAFFSKHLLNQLKIKLKQRIKRNTAFLLYNTFSLLPLKQKTCVFESYGGRNFSGNPLYIMKELLRHSGYRCVVSTLNPDKYCKYGRETCIKKGSLKYIYYLATSKFTVNNINFPDFVKKRTGSYHIQTMHGTPLKLMGDDIINLGLKPSRMNLLALYNRCKRWDLLVSPNKYTTKIYSRCFKYKGEVLEVGYPRNDVLINGLSTQRIDEIKSSLNIPPNKKIILFAPTWRGKNKRVRSFDALNMNIDTLRSELGDQYVILFKLHHLVSSGLPFDPDDTFALNASGYSDIQELCVISDMLITDYSSLMFDYAVMKKKILLYLHDYDVYMQNRGSYFDIRKQPPGTIAFNLDELVAQIKDDSIKVNDYFLETFCHANNGNASEIVVNKILQTK